MPEAATLISTSPAFGCGVGRSASLRTSGAPNSVISIAFICVNSKIGLRCLLRSSALAGTSFALSPDRGNHVRHARKARFSRGHAMQAAYPLHLASASICNAIHPVHHEKRPARIRAAGRCPATALLRRRFALRRARRAVVQQRLRRQTHTTLLVRLDDLDLHLLAVLQVVVDVLDALVRDLGEMQ